MYSSLLQKLPIAVAGILLLVAVLTIYIRSKNVTKSEFFKIFKSARYISAWILIFVFVLTGVFAIFNHMKAKHSVSAVVALNYSEASQAQNSNGTRYNMAEIISDEVAKVDDNTNKGKKGTAIRDYERYCTLLINDFDIQKLEAKIRPLCSKGTKVSPVINRYKEIMKEKELNQSIYTKEKILNLVKTETQITTQMREDLFFGKLN